MSLSVFTLLVLVTVALVYVQRQRRDLEPVVDELDDLY